MSGSPPAKRVHMESEETDFSVLERPISGSNGISDGECEFQVKRKHKLNSVSDVNSSVPTDQPSELLRHPELEKHPTYDELQEIVAFLLEKTSIRPRLGIICGSGLGGLADNLDEDKPRKVLCYRDIPGFPLCRVKGHAGNLVFGSLSGQPVVCMQGRFHFYEGHPAWKIAMPVRVMKLLGVKILIVTNAAGGLNERFQMGNIMVMKDHINLVGMSGLNPLIGANEDRFGPRFPAMTHAYDRDLRRLTLETARELNMDHFMQEGVYVHLCGPSYETPAESRILRLLGADCVGMSTAPEVVAAKHCGMRVLGLSLITNIVITSYDSDRPEPTHQEVMETAREREKDMERLVKRVIKKLSEQEDTNIR